MANLAARFANFPMDEDAESTRYISFLSKYHLPDNIVSTHYDIKLIYHIDDVSFNFDGESRIVVQVCRPTNRLNLHAQNLTIDEDATKLIDSYEDSYVPTAHNHDNETEILTIEFENDISPGKYTLHLNFVGALQEKQK